MHHEVNLHVGRQIQERRRHDGMTQRQLADAAGVNSEQMQKYETGETRVAATHLWRIADIQGVHISYYFEGLDALHGNEPPVQA